VEQYSVLYDGDERHFSVVKWDNPQKPVTGTVVFKSHTEQESMDWITAAIQEENTEIYNEFG
jgi:hypothetical protein